MIARSSCVVACGMRRCTPPDASMKALVPALPTALTLEAVLQRLMWTPLFPVSADLLRAPADTVLVNDFVRHTTILLHAGQSYLAKKP